MRHAFVSLTAATLLLACPSEGPADDELGTSSDTSSETSSGSETSTSTTSTGETSTSDASDTASETGGVCPTPLPPEAFDPDKQLSFGLFFPHGILELPIGSSEQFQVGLTQCCVVWEPLETCSVYSLEPAGSGATIDPDSGLLELGSAPDGTLLTVRADVEEGTALVEGEVFVYDPALHMLKGTYQEVSRFPCDNGPEFVPDDPINELVLTASGKMIVTWTPFEIYTDYMADFEDAIDGTFTFTNADGNYVPSDLDGEGNWVLEGNDLVLTELWLGSSQGAVTPAACGHRFSK